MVARTLLETDSYSLSLLAICAIFTYCAIHTSHRSLLLHDLGVSNTVFDALLLDPTLLCTHPPRGLVVIAFQTETSACSTRWMTFVALLSPHTTGEAAWKVSIVTKRNRAVERTGTGSSMSFGSLTLMWFAIDRNSCWSRHRYSHSHIHRHRLSLGEGNK